MGHPMSMAFRSFPPLSCGGACRRWLNRRTMRTRMRLREAVPWPPAYLSTVIDKMEIKRRGGVLQSFCNRYPIVPA
jgi:hypothetical protein